MKTQFGPHSSPEKGACQARRVTWESTRVGQESEGEGGLWTKLLLWSPREGTEEAEWAASGLACLVSLSRLWGIVTVLAVWYLALGSRLGQVDSGLEGKSSTEEVVGMWALDRLACI